MEDNASTTIDMAAQASRLQTVYQELQTANLTVGYLEATLSYFQEQSDALALAKSQADRLTEYEQENQEMLAVYEQAKMAEQAVGKMKSKPKHDAGEYSAAQAALSHLKIGER